PAPAARATPALPDLDLFSFAGERTNSDNIH
ncbi:jg12261, partial [Pararge aegeria aegeria]